MTKPLLQSYRGWHKLINGLLVLLVAGFVFYLPYFMQSGGCEAAWCTYEVRAGILDPLHTALEYFLYLPLVLLFFPTRYFRRWLWFIASWGIPVVVLMAATSPITISGFISVDERNLVAILFTAYFVYFSAFMILVFIAYDLWRWYRTRGQ